MILVGSLAMEEMPWVREGCPVGRREKEEKQSEWVTVLIHDR